MADRPPAARDSDPDPERMLEEAARGTDGQRLEVLERLYDILETELEGHRGQAGPPGH